MVLRGAEGSLILAGLQTGGTRGGEGCSSGDSTSSKSDSLHSRELTCARGSSKDQPGPS